MSTYKYMGTTAELCRDLQGIPNLQTIPNLQSIPNLQGIKLPALHLEKPRKMFHFICAWFFGNKNSIVNGLKISKINFMITLTGSKNGSVQYRYFS